jgi:hypothetical protein
VKIWLPQFSLASFFSSIIALKICLLSFLSKLPYEHFAKSSGVENQIGKATFTQS